MHQSDQQRRQVHKETGLSEGRQRLRERRARRWAARITVLMNVSGCTAAQALAAVEDADRRREEAR